MEAIRNLIPSISVVLFSFLKAVKKFPQILFSGFKSGIILCTFPFTVLVVDVYGAEKSGSTVLILWIESHEIEQTSVAFLSGVKVNFYEMWGKGIICKLVKDGNVLHLFRFSGGGFRDITLIYHALNYWFVFIRSKLENKRKNLDSTALNGH